VSDLDSPSPADTLDGVSTVEVRTSASAALIPTIRAVASDLAARADFDLDAISDLRMAVDEACATLVDVAGGHFGVDHLREGTTMTTADLVIRYLRPIRQGTAFAVPRMLRSGRRAMVMQIDVYGDGEGDEALLATATVNFAVIDGATPKLPDWPRA